MEPSSIVTREPSPPAVFREVASRPAARGRDGIGDTSLLKGEEVREYDL